MIDCLIVCAPTATPNVVKVCHICDRTMLPEVYAVVYALMLLTFVIAGIMLLASVAWGSLKLARLLKKHW